LGKRDGCSSEHEEDGGEQPLEPHATNSFRR
jgi:hypothetical protein